MPGAAVIFPVLSTPTLMMTLLPPAGPVDSKTSVLLMVNFTGTEAFLASTAAIGSRYAYNLPPKPPPISIGITLTLEIVVPIILAVLSRI